MAKIQKFRSMALVSIFVIFNMLDALFAQRRISQEARVFYRVKESVFTVFGDRGHGSGFLIDKRGLILTNQHIIASSKYIRVQLNDSTKVKAIVLSSDKEKDVAILLINETFCNNIEVLPIASPSDTVVYIGEKVIAVGNAFNQGRFMTAGIVNKVEPDVIISDININPEGSGGPLVNMDGIVVGMNNFGDLPNRGPNMQGSLLITKDNSIIKQAKIILGNVTPPTTERLPVQPKNIFPLESLQRTMFVEKFDEKPYNVSKLKYTGNFLVTVVTPPYHYYRIKRVELRLTKECKDWGNNGDIEGQYSNYLFNDLKKWPDNTSRFSPVVSFEVIPIIGQTSNKTIRNILGAMGDIHSDSYSKLIYNYKYKRGLYDFQVYRNGILQNDMMRANIMQPLAFSVISWDGKYGFDEMVLTGYFNYDFKIFKPVNGIYPTIKLKIYDRKASNSPEVVILPEKTVRKAWDDFAPYAGDEFAAGGYKELIKKEKTELAAALIGFSMILMLMGIIVILAG